MSLEKRDNIRPTGVTSKNVSGVLRILFNRYLCRCRQAPNAPTYHTRSARKAPIPVNAWGDLTWKFKRYHERNALEVVGNIFNDIRGQNNLLISGIYSNDLSKLQFEWGFDWIFIKDEIRLKIRRSAHFGSDLLWVNKDEQGMNGVFTGRLRYKRFTF